MKKQEIYKVAVIVEPNKDNVAVAFEGLKKGYVLKVGKAEFQILDDIEPGDRLAIQNVPKGRPVIQYGYPFGISKGIKVGEKLNTQNVLDKLPKRFAQELIKPKIENLHDYKSIKFKGYKRANGSVGTRNFYLIIPTSMCASATANLIAQHFEYKYPNVDAVLSIHTTEGCGCAKGTQIERYLTVLRNFAIHCNVGGVLFVDLGCEHTNASALKNFINEKGLDGRSDLKVDWLTIQKTGGVQNTVRLGVKLIKKNINILTKIRRTECNISNLIIGTECGASDAFSGITANSVIGTTLDKIINAGGAGIISETPEMRGTERFLISRMVEKDTIAKFKQIMNWYKQLAKKLGYNMDDNLVDANKSGGLFNATIKSLGAVMKSGTTPIVDIVEYGEKINGKGLYIMQGPGNDPESVTGLASSGCNIICFSTGKGTVTGCAIVPVIKISSNTNVYKKMPNDIDFDTGMILGSKDIITTKKKISDLLLDRIISVASGEITCAEVNKQRQFQVWTAGKLSL